MHYLITVPPSPVQPYSLTRFIHAWWMRQSHSVTLFYSRIVFHLIVMNEPLYALFTSTPYIVSRLTYSPILVAWVRMFPLGAHLVFIICLVYHIYRGVLRSAFDVYIHWLRLIQHGGSYVSITYHINIMCIIVWTVGTTLKTPPLFVHCKIEFMSILRGFIPSLIIISSYCFHCLCAHSLKVQ